MKKTGIAKYVFAFINIFCLCCIILSYILAFFGLDTNTAVTMSIIAAMESFINVFYFARVCKPCNENKNEEQHTKECLDKSDENN